MPLVGLLTLTKSPGARAHYDYRRARGDTHNAALRNLANKLLGRLCRQVRDRSVSNNWDQKRTGRLRVGTLTVARRAPLSEPDAHCLAFRRPQKAGLVCEHHCLDAVAEIADDSRTDWAGFHRESRQRVHGGLQGATRPCGQDCGLPWTPPLRPR
jgi:hypothetical protein